MGVLTDRGEAKATLTVTPAQIEQAGTVDSAQLAEALPAELAGVLDAVLAIIARGGTVTIGSIPNELTTTTAADMLDISRPTLMKLIKNGKLSSHKVGTHTRLNASDVLAYRETRRNEQRDALADLRAFEDELGRSY